MDVYIYCQSTSPIDKLSECLVNNGCVHLLLINFSYKRVNYLLEYWKKALILYYLETTRSLSLFFDIIIVNKLKADILPTDS